MGDVEHENNACCGTSCIVRNQKPTSFELLVALKVL